MVKIENKRRIKTSRNECKKGENLPTNEEKELVLSKSPSELMLLTRVTVKTEWHVSLRGDNLFVNKVLRYKESTFSDHKQRLSLSC